MKGFLLTWKELALPVGIMGTTVILSLTAHYLFFKVAERLAKRSKRTLDDTLVKRCRAPARIIVPVMAVYFVLPLMKLSPAILVFLKQSLALLLIASVAWLIIGVTYVIEDLVLSQFRIDVRDNLRARRIHTQIQILKKVVIIIVGVIALATVLMTFEKVRQLGTSILASAGILGIIIGIAAQRSIATLLAGLQLAVTQPIRIDDVVIVENEWGRIEEITLTYVVVRIWDLRRLIVPMTYFLEKPFQNWTRVSAELLGTVFLYVDYTVPVQAVRDELHRILENSRLWDGRVCVLQVTNATERTVELRALMSTPDASTAWELRCEVREKLIEFIRTNYPNGLPKVRGELHGLDRNKILSQDSVEVRATS
jgi:small-conductance mechanosensitive channel